MRRTPEQIEDEMLVLEAQAGDASALATLVTRWRPRMLRHARLMADDEATADDAVQEAWLGIARGLTRLADPADFAGWAMRIVSNKCADAVRARSRRRTLVAGASSRRVPQAARAAEDDLGALRAAIEDLPPHLRETVSLFHGCGLSVRQTAEALSIPTGTVKSRLNESRARLRARLEEGAGHERVR
jgi:RNA polymerase sigma-70 factor (ECF subfamily)